MDPDFEKELCNLLNRKGIDNKLNTPDYVLTKFICNILDGYFVLTEGKRKHKLEGPNVLPSVHRTI